jgi:hypothetical protein
VELKPCGTRAAYARHLRYGENPCGPCRDANNAYATSRKKDPGSQPARSSQWTKRNATSRPVPVRCRGCGSRGVTNARLRVRVVDECVFCKVSVRSQSDLTHISEVLDDMGLA